MKLSRVLGAFAVALVLAGCTPDGPMITDPGPTSTPSSLQSTTAAPSDTTTSQASTTPTTEEQPFKLKLNFVGDCSPKGGSIKAVASGFTPGGQYLTEVTRPDGNKYTGFNNVGTVSDKGTLSGWEWPCQDDKPGLYRAQITDLETGLRISRKFEILSS